MTAPVLEGPPQCGPVPVLSNPRAFLTPRQRQVLVLIANGHTNRAIGRRLGTCEDTVKCLVRKILRQLHVDDRAQATAVALRIGLLSPDEINIPAGLRHLTFDPE